MFLMVLCHRHRADNLSVYLIIPMLLIKDPFKLGGTINTATAILEKCQKLKEKPVQTNMETKAL